MIDIISALNFLLMKSSQGEPFIFLLDDRGTQALNSIYDLRMSIVCILTIDHSAKYRMYTLGSILLLSGPYSGA